MSARKPCPHNAGHFDFGSLLVGVALASYVVAGLFLFLSSLPLHRDLCREKFARAQTAPDSLAVIVSDDYCDDYVRRNP